MCHGILGKFPERTIHFKLITGYKARQKNYLSHLSSYIAKLFWFVINNAAKALVDANENTVAITMIIFFLFHCLVLSKMTI